MDIFVSRGDVQSPAMADRRKIDQPNTVFQPAPRGKWVALTEEAGFTAKPPCRHRGSAFGDLNHDGKLDLAVSALGAQAEIWWNDGAEGNHWLEITLQGTKSNRDGIGAKIKLVADGQAQYNHVTTATGYASSSAGPVHFGLGRSDRVDEVEVLWPSGTRQRIKDVASNQMLHLKEPR